MTLFDRFRTLARNESGGIAVYTAFFAMLGIGAGALALDIGRMSLLRTEMQNRADAGAMAGARYLDGSIGAQGRAREVAILATLERSRISSSAELVVPETGIQFYSGRDPQTDALLPVAFGADAESRFMRVSLEQREMTVYFTRVLDLLVGEVSPTVTTVNATAVAGSQPFICNAPPLMICAFDDPPGNGGTNIKDPSNIGRQLRLKQASSGGTTNSAWAPGDYGLLSVDDGSNAAGAIEAALAAVEPQECYSYDINVAPGQKSNKVKNGINARFELGTLANNFPPAPNIIDYPQDIDLKGNNKNLGNGEWVLEGPNGYWKQTHGVDFVPTDLTSIAGTGQQATRYQTYLYELGEPFLVNTQGPGAGKEVIHPIPTDGEIPNGYTLVPSSLTAEVPPAGQPTQDPASNGPARRLVEVAVLKCSTNDVRGEGIYPTEGNYLEVFLTEFVQDPNNNATIYGEVVRALSPLNSPEFFSNVQLVE